MELTLSLGTNLGNKLQNLKTAYLLIEEKIGKIISQSKIYCSEAWGYQSNNEFYNTVVVVETVLLPYQILEIIANIEDELGRQRKHLNTFEDRIIDIDILFYNSLIINCKNLKIPHPKIQYRLFVLLPLCEISPNFVHPELQLPLCQLLDRCEDISKITQTAQKIW